MMRSTHLSLLLMGFFLLPNSFFAQNIQDILQEYFPDLDPEWVQFEPDDPNDNPPEFRLRAVYSKIWDLDLVTWTPLDSTEYHYDENGNRDEILTLTWDGMNWVNKRRTIYTINDQGQLLAFEGQTWVNEEWGHEDFDLLVSFEYDENGNTTIIDFQFWQENVENWVYNSKNTYTYDLSTNLLQERIYELAPLKRVSWKIGIATCSKNTMIMAMNFW